MNNLLPPNATAEERALSQAIARLGDVEPHCRQMWNATTCPTAHLPWLAWAFSVDGWDSSWSETKKRDVIRASYTVHRYKGTVGALRAALGALGYAIELREWHQETPTAEPYTFGLVAELRSGEQVDARMWEEITAIALSAKNVRSHLSYVRLRATVQGAFYVGGSTLAAETVEIQPLIITELETQGVVHLATALVVTETVVLKPLGEPVLTLQDGAPLTLTDGAPLRLLH